MSERFVSIPNFKQSVILPSTITIPPGSFLVEANRGEELNNEDNIRVKLRDVFSLSSVNVSFSTNNKSMTFTFPNRSLENLQTVSIRSENRLFINNGNSIFIEETGVVHDGFRITDMNSFFMEFNFS